MVDLDNLTPAQEAAVHRFVDKLLNGEAVSRHDFPEMDGAEFEELANAIVAATNTRTIQ